MKKNNNQEILITADNSVNSDEKINVSNDSMDVSTENRSEKPSASELMNINEVMSKISYAPFFIASLSRPVFSSKISLNVISSIAMHVNPLINRYAHVPITFNGFRRHFDLKFVQRICIVTNNQHFATWFIHYFTKGTVSIDIQLFSSIEHLLMFREYINNNHSKNTIFIFYFLSWAEITSEFARHGYNLTGGISSKRHTLSPLSFRFSQSIMELGFTYENVKENYANSAKENIQVLNNNQIIATNMCKSLLETSRITTVSNEELNKFNKESNKGE